MKVQSVGNESPNIHNYAVRLIRKDQSGRWIEDKHANEIAFIEHCGYNYTIKDLVKAVLDIKLPKDIMIQMAHNWVGKLPKGSPIDVIHALMKQNYVAVKDAEDWFREKKGKVIGSKFIISCDKDVDSLKRIIWEESTSPFIEWEKSDELKKATEKRPPFECFVREWWM